MAKSLSDALTEIRADESLSHKFMNNPLDTLEGLGVDVSELRAKKAAAESGKASIGAEEGMCGLCW